ncbi:4'-phosphopantetheinyl transferase superfamily protein [Streptomyces olivaceoviridis]|uniref:4'-phosphopantetheinyl transferase superfamily protein n=1 Tax=Streptomyces olivaceoviridis TaxID=1921 RepID=UPI0036976EDB
MLFSIKESIFKAWYPRTGYGLGFEQAEVTVSPQSHTFTCRLILPERAPPSSWLTDTQGRWLVGTGSWSPHWWCRPAGHRSRRSVLSLLPGGSESGAVGVW